MEKTETVKMAFRITGRVQGVFYRVWTQELGQTLGLGGTVKNLPDGSVEAHVAGPREVVELFETRLWEGPPASRVEGVAVFPSEVELDPTTFRILR